MRSSPLLEEVRDTLGTLREEVDEALRALKNDDPKAFRQHVEEAEGWAEAVLEDLEKLRQLAVDQEPEEGKKSKLMGACSFSCEARATMIVEDREGKMRPACAAHRGNQRLITRAVRAVRTIQGRP